MAPVRIAGIGCGLGGAALGLLLEQAGYQPTIYRQAPQFLRIGAGIHLTPNLTRILSSVGLLPAQTACDLNLKSARKRKPTWSSGLTACLRWCARRLRPLPSPSLPGRWPTAPPLAPDDLTKWWLGERFMIGYDLTRARDQYYFVAGLDAPSWPPGAPGLWPPYERPPETVWSDGPLVLLGDACHPRRPHMAQGAAMAIEDAAVLVRCLQQYAPRGPQQVGAAYAHYQRTRAARTAQGLRIRRPERAAGLKLWAFAACWT